VYNETYHSEVPSTEILYALIHDLSEDSKIFQQLRDVKEFDPKTLSLVSNNNVWEAYQDCSRVGEVYLTAFDGVKEANEKGMFIINTAGEFEGKLNADLEFDIQPHSMISMLMIDKAVGEIDQRVRDGINVSVNCRMDMERSALVIAKYLEDIHGMTMDQAYFHLMSIRPIVLDRRSWIEGELY